MFVALYNLKTTNIEPKEMKKLHGLIHKSKCACPRNSGLQMEHNRCMKHFLQIGLDAAIDLKIEIYFVKSITVIELQKSLLLSNLFIWVDSILSVRSYPRGISPIPELGQQIPAPPIDPYMTLKEIAIDRSRISLSEIIMEGKKKTHRV